MKKNDKIVGTCSGYTKEGLGVVKIDGFPLFVKGILQNETAEMVVTLVKKHMDMQKSCLSKNHQNSDVN